MNDFTYRVVAQTLRTISIQMKFTNPLLISATNDKETMTVTFRDVYMFLGTNGQLIEKKNRVIKRQMPPQLSESAKEVQQMLTDASKAASAVIGINFLLTIALSASLNQLLGAVNTI